MRVYKFLTCQCGLRAIRERRLKISEIRSLNDPFELLPFDLSDPDTRRGLIASREEFGKSRGLLCFSMHWHNPVLWAHHADGNRGICLGFDIPDDLQQPVTYVEQPIRLTHLDCEIANKTLFTKYEHWHYEEEIRTWASLEEKSGEDYFYNFGETLRLAEIIIGPGCMVSKRRVLQALGANQKVVRLLKARLAYTAFRVVEDENGFDGG
jgi:hypothetical protein